MLGLDLGPVSTLFSVGSATGLSDGELLERFLGDSRAASEAAFAVLVARHGPMVMGVCRRVLADPDDVDDAFQATFLVLVRKAGSVRVSDSLGRWLYGVSRKVASRARLEAARRPAAAGDSANSWQARPSPETELAEALHEEIDRLPRRYREAVRMCYLEGLALKEAAELIGCPLGTVGSRLSRARDLLKSRLGRRGLATSAVAIASWLDAGQARAAVSASLVAKVTGVAGQTPAGTVPASVGNLVAAVLRGFTMMKIGISVGLFCAIGLGSIGAAMVISPQEQSKLTQPPARGSTDGPSPADRVAKLKTIVDAHAASVAAVGTLSFKFAFNNAVTGRANGLYHRSGTDYILKVSYADGRSQTTSSVGGLSKALFRKVGQVMNPLEGIVEVDNGDLATECDPYYYNLLRFYGQLKFRCELPEILAQPCTCKYVGSVERNGRPLERVELSHARADITIDFDPAVNYLARVVVARSKLAGGAGQPVMEQAVTEFSEVAPGVYYPAKVRCVNTVTGEQTWGIEFTDIKINEPISKESLTFQFPPQVLVMDKVRSGMFVTDAAGEPTQPATTKDGHPLLLATGASPGVARDDPEMPAPPSRYEAGSLTRWVLPVALALLGAGIVLGVVRRRRRRRSE
jgi:RNA polymerase sigma factor (sigma-70 family)